MLTKNSSPRISYVSSRTDCIKFYNKLNYRRHTHRLDTMDGMSINTDFQNNSGEKKYHTQNQRCYLKQQKRILHKNVKIIDRN